MGMLFARRKNKVVGEVTTTSNLLQKEPIKVKSVPIQPQKKVEQSTQPKFKI